MRSDADREIALECLKLAAGFGGDVGDAILAAKDLYAFVTGDDSAGKLDKVREAIK